MGMVGVLSCVVGAVGYWFFSDDWLARRRSDPPLARLATIPVSRAADWSNVDNPFRDGWDTEAFHESLKAPFHSLGKFFQTRDETLIGKLFANGSSGVSLVGESSSQVFNVGRVEVRLSPSTETSDSAAIEAIRAGSDQPTVHGKRGLIEEFRRLADRFDGCDSIHSKFKVFRVIPDPDGVITRQFVWIGGRSDEGSVQMNATWTIRWDTADLHAVQPRIQQIHVDRTEWARLTGAGQGFTDVTASALSRNECYREQFLRGMNDWYGRIQDPGYFSLLGTPALALGDVNGDGLDDLFVSQEFGLPNRLFLGQADGTLRDCSREYGVDWLESSRGALLVDLDNDGDQDLVVAIMGGLVLAENQRGQRFKVRRVLGCGDDPMTIAAADFDQDGRLDIFVCVYYADRRLGENDTGAHAGGSEGFVFHDATNGGRNRLYRNLIRGGDDSEWTMVDVTESSGIDRDNARYSLAAGWDDVDNDGDLDLYVANDFGRDNLLINQLQETGRATFVDRGQSMGAESAGAGMAVAWSDVNRDGFMDIFVSNMFSSAGNRITYQQQFKSGTNPRIRRRYQRLARGNSLLLNCGGKRLKETSHRSGVEIGRWAWGAQFGDLNNDGWEDLVVANGYISTDDTGDL